MKQQLPCVGRKGWRGARDFRIRAITAQSSVIKSIELVPNDGEPVADFLPGQYLTSVCARRTATTFSTASIR